MRFTSIDLLRTLAIAIMVLVHFTENLAGYTPIVAGIGAPLFMFLSGVSYRLWLNSQLARDRADNEISRVTIRRGLFLFALGFLFNVLVWMPEDIFNWDVLTLIGFSLMAMEWARRVSTVVVLSLCGLIFLVSPAVREVADWPSYWNEGFYDPNFSMADVLLGFLAVGYFPILPWLMVPLVGFTVGTDFFGNGRTSEPTERALRRGYVGGGLMIGLAVTAVFIRNYFPQWFPAAWPDIWSMFPPSPIYLMGVLGWAWFSFAIAYRWFDSRSSSHQFLPLRGIAHTFSKHSLSIYLLHHVLHVWPLWIWGAVTTDDMTSLWRSATTVPQAIGLAGICLVVCYLIFRWWEHRQWPTAETCMRRVCG